MNIQEAFDKAVVRAKEDAKKQEKINERENVISKYGKIFHPDNLDNLTKEDFKAFCKFDNNRHWTNDRVSGWDSEKKKGTIEQVRNGLKILLDESRPLSERINQIDDEQNMMPGIGYSVYTSILYIVYPEKYPIVNGAVISQLDKLGKYSLKDFKKKKKSESIPAIQKIVKQYADELQLNFWSTDWIWYWMMKGPTSTADSMSPLLKFLKEDEMKMFRNYQPIVIKMLLEARNTNSKSTIKQAAITILQQNGNPMHYEEITEKALEQNLFKTEGETPKASLLSEMTKDISSNGKNAIFIRINDGVYGLNDYSSKSKPAVTVKAIREEIAKLGFGTDSESSISSVSGTLARRKLVDFTGINENDTATLKEGVVNTNEIQECLKICGQIIAKWHINEIVRGDYNLWRMPPGRASENYPFEQDFLESNTIGIGWEKIGDDIVKKNMTKDQIEELFRKNFPPTEKEPNSPQPFTNFTYEMKPKDIVVLIKKKTIVDFAIVVGPYRRLPDNAKSYKHRRDVVWLNRGMIPENEAFEFSRMSTCDRVADAQLKKQYINLLLGKKGSTMSTDIEQNDSVDSRTIQILERKKNIILQGPPGTGKTWNAKKIAKKLTENQTSETQKIWLWPVTPENWKVVVQKKTWGSSSDINKLKEVISKNDLVVFYVNTTNEIQGIFKFSGDWYQANENIWHGDHDAGNNIDIDEICQGHLDIRTLHNILDLFEGAKSTNAINARLQSKGKIPRGPASELTRRDFNIIAERMEMDIENKFTRIVTFHQSYGYEEFIEGIRPKSINNIITYPIEHGIFRKICDAARVWNDKFVLIIDEINRGNISKIFGELITIIENDKRGKKDVVTLAYSGDSFYVPENVYIIGTMNTADQSLTQIDAALKRRFSSIEIMPDSSILKKGMKNLPELLDKINGKIREKRSRDNQIGHSYFMQDGNPITDIKELQFVFATDIIPLLRDYFYDSDDDLKEVLGGQFIDWDEGSDRNLKDDWQDNAETFRTVIEEAYDIRI